MNIDLTRHGGYELGLSQWFYLFAGLMLLIPFIIWVIASFRFEEEGRVQPSFKDRLGYAALGLLGVPMLMMLPIVAIAFGMGCGLFGQALDEVRDKPYHTNMWQVSKKVPESKITYPDGPGSRGADTLTSPDDGSDYDRRIWSEVSKHYAVNLISMKVTDVAYFTDPMPVLLKEEKSGKVRNCQLNVGKVNKVSHDRDDYVKSFDGYLICQGSEAPTR